MQALKDLIEQDQKKMGQAAKDYAERVLLDVFSGRVTSTAERLVSTRVTSGKDSTLTVDTTPEIWVTGKTGQERRFVDVTVSECRVGHDITLVISMSNSAVLAMDNHSAGQTWFAPELSEKTVDVAHYWRIGFSVAFFTLVFVMLPAMVLSGDAGLHPVLAWIIGTPLQIAAIGIGVIVPERRRRKHNLKAEALRERIQSELASQATVS